VPPRLLSGQILYEVQIYCWPVATDQRASLPVIRTGTVSWPPLVQALRFVWWSVVSALPDRERSIEVALQAPARQAGWQQARTTSSVLYSTSESLLVALLVHTPLRHDVDWTGPQLPVHQVLSTAPLPSHPPSAAPPTQPRSVSVTA
jgi:hypothetical protein